MAVYKFGENDVFVNTLEAYPETSFYIHSGTVVIDSIPNLVGQNQSNILHVADGHISLYEINVDRPSGQEITGTVFADGFRTTAGALDQNNYQVQFDPGDVINIDYNLSSSIYHYYYPQAPAGNFDESAQISVDEIQNTSTTPSNGRIIHGYKNSLLQELPNNSTQLGVPIPYSIEGVLDRYSFQSPHFKMKTVAPLPVRDLRTAEMAVISIPSIFYGSSIKKGTVELNYYVSGSKIATLRDRGNRGELIQTYSTSSSPVDYSGSVAGLVLYNEGVIILTGSWQLGDDNSIDYSGSSDTENKWTHFGSGLHKDISAFASLPSASYSIDFQGTTHIPNITMLCNAPYSELNWSNNPTFVNKNSSYIGTFNSSSNHYVENEVDIANVTHTELVDYVPEQVKETYISKVAIYDEKKNLIGVAKVANPVRKTPDRSYLFKLKLDL